MGMLSCSMSQKKQRGDGSVRGASEWRQRDSPLVKKIRHKQITSAVSTG